MKKSKNSKQKKKVDKEKIKEELKKLKIKLPEQKKSEEKEDLLEEQVQETEKVIEDNEFHEFFQSSERNFSSLLNKIETPAENLEANIASTPVSSNQTSQENQNPMNYSPNQDYAREEVKKYLIENTSVSLRRTETREPPRQQLINPFEEPRDTSRGVQEEWRDELMEVGALNETRTTLPFEKEDKKYRQVKHG